MCFSASASFGLGTALLIVGVATVWKVVTPSQLPFAGIPLIFSLQQFTEGFLWLSLTNASWQNSQQLLTYLFLVFAQVIWPFWVPFSIFLVEENVRRKKILIALTGFGSVIALYVIYALFNYTIDSHVSGKHVSYQINFPGNISKLSALFYFIPTIIPAFVSSVKSMIFLGIALLLSFVVTKLFYEEHVISVWCYFAAAISIVVIIVMRAFQKKNNPPVHA